MEYLDFESYWGPSVTGVCSALGIDHAHFQFMLLILLYYYNINSVVCNE